MKEGAWKMADVTNIVLLDREEEVVATRDTTNKGSTSGSTTTFAGQLLRQEAEGEQSCNQM